MKKKRPRKANKTRNKFEDRIFQQLAEAKITFKYECERIPYVLAGYYLPDFVLTTPNGVVYIETKGYLRPEHKRKMCAVKKQHPELDLRILFYSHNKTNIRWAEKNGIKYAINEIPEDWLRGF